MVHPRLPAHSYKYIRIGCVVGQSSFLTVCYCGIRADYTVARYCGTRTKSRLTVRVLRPRFRCYFALQRTKRRTPGAPDQSCPLSHEYEDRRDEEQEALLRLYDGRIAVHSTLYTHARQARLWPMNTPTPRSQSNLLLVGLHHDRYLVATQHTSRANWWTVQVCLSVCDPTHVAFRPSLPGPASWDLTMCSSLSHVQRGFERLLKRPVVVQLRVACASISASAPRHPRLPRLPA